MRKFNLNLFCAFFLLIGIITCKNTIGYSANKINCGSEISDDFRFEAVTTACVINYSSVVVTNRNGCSSTNDGSICVTISYTGVPLNNQFDLSINNGLTWTLGVSGVSTLCKNNLAAGDYKLIIRDRFGCTTTYPGNPVTIEHDICIPDANFKAILVGDTLINTNRDTEIQRSEAKAFTGKLDVGYSSIADLTG